MNLHLETDDDPRTRQFIDEHNGLSDKALRTPEFARDRDAIKALIERQDRLIVPMRRGGWLFDFRQSKDNPLGVWLRLPADQQPLPDAGWGTSLRSRCLLRARRQALELARRRHLPMGTDTGTAHTFGRRLRPSPAARIRRRAETGCRGRLRYAGCTIACHLAEPRRNLLFRFHRPIFGDPLRMATGRAAIEARSATGRGCRHVRSSR